VYVIGIPILGAIRGEDLSDTVCVVVRYFGGIKLGAGGLIRAYGSAARLVLRDAPEQVLVPTASTRLSVGASYVGVVYDIVAKVGGQVGADEEYGDDGTVTLSVTCNASQRERFHNGLRDATRGEVQIHEEDEVIEKL
jgi:putative IMPACT (imprinted ancient) family translation regulator